MAWDRSKWDKPRGWDATKRRILRRDRGVCYLCGHPGAGSVDHRLAIAEGGTHDDDNLGAVHHDPCHLRKTRAEAQRARARSQARLKRPPEPHPGMLPPPPDAA